MRESRHRGRLRISIAAVVVVTVIAVLSACPTGPVGGPETDTRTYTVSYDANGADSGTAPDDQTKKEGVDLTLAFNSGNLTRTGVRFSGWSTAVDGSGNAYAEGATYSTDADLTLYAKWSPYAIGDSGPAGGIVFYDDDADGIDNITGGRYLEAWIADEPGTYQWQTSTEPAPGSTVVGTGYENTYTIMAGADFPAAEVVRNATHGGYDDWFLPSKDALNEIYLHRVAIGGFASDYYWSSSAYSTASSWMQHIATGDQFSTGMTTHLRVRAVRAF